MPGSEALLVVNAAAVNSYLQGDNGFSILAENDGILADQHQQRCDHRPASLLLAAVFVGLAYALLSVHVQHWGDPGPYGEYGYNLFPPYEYMYGGIDDDQCYSSWDSSHRPNCTTQHCSWRRCRECPGCPECDKYNQSRKNCGTQQRRQQCRQCPRCSGCDECQQHDMATAGFFECKKWASPPCGSHGTCEDNSARVNPDERCKVRHSGFVCHCDSGWIGQVEQGYEMDAVGCMINENQAHDSLVIVGDIVTVSLWSADIDKEPFSFCLGLLMSAVIVPVCMASCMASALFKCGFWEPVSRAVIPSQLGVFNRQRRSDARIFFNLGACCFCVPCCFVFLAICLILYFFAGDGEKW